MPQGVGVESSFSLGWDVKGWRQSSTTGGTLHDKVIARQFAQANNGILAGADPALDTANTDNYLDMKKEAVDRKSLGMAKVHVFFGDLAGQPEPKC